MCKWFKIFILFVDTCTVCCINAKPNGMTCRSVQNPLISLVSILTVKGLLYRVPLCLSIRRWVIHPPPPRVLEGTTFPCGGGGGGPNSYD